MRTALGWIGRKGAAATGVLALVAGMSGMAMAKFSHPEIDPGSIANALLVFSGGLLIVTGRRSRQ